jgi:ferredoxin--NADP+ reductase
MSTLGTERVLSVHHWNDSLFSFKTTRNPGLRFANGQFVMIGMEVNGKPLMRAYSIASANYEEHLEFFSIKVQDGPPDLSLAAPESGRPSAGQQKANRNIGIA